ncbi:MAG: hypothetical protein AAGI52_00165 [Bacteroidota bacterium]
MRVCAIDVGTNTVNSLVADVSPEGLAVLADEERFARLGQGVDAAGRLAPDAMDRVVDRLAAAKATAEQYGAEQILIGATSASRDASNVDELQARVLRELELEYRVISGAEEARLSFLGALALVPHVSRAVVFDVGGGSTEIVSGERGQLPGFVRSLDIGTVRLTERHGAVPPVSPERQSSVRQTVHEALATIPPDVWARGPLVGTGSTAKVAAYVAGTDGAIPREPIQAARARLASLTPEAITTLAPDVMAGRADVMVAALILVEGLMEVAGADTFVSSAGGLRHGIALEAVNGSDEARPGV